MTNNEEKLKLMIVEDCPDIREVLHDALSEDYEVVLPLSEEEVIYFFKQTSPRFVVLDYMLWDGCRGDQLLRFMKDINPQVIVIMHTSWQERGFKEKLLKQGAHRFVEKRGDSISELRMILREAA
ncbi:MAG: hypothetical protein A3G33_08445 [Omnitrophica bacterium RIFCSPLOWO2_12_FULL_44_17]|uniref:Response regulatory domain-containing protein n=1 Tax=Candidatus Danuiimicrobium aquiferis TaxID=1801832 RepID=A0A1G1KW38_9BACT|nr:MAG: hypothetical protein A3B72_03665 [Omnitrophica bacterium RIFCSPHIGHO2_02_FULL_45_28]OGW92051.1 MAG: hypothetical protein A3E74_01940 [Omnitrophica bacterium RIFCSPHIGHO2_12_FULL_44_12]OGW97194.1 MAG: hypothetical protein A3G33_08445 [Omnitrophica bacterium RIFCSPLOWO2_12_FULL_44_17]OGX02250.1 MAG: hypothetical protein A3J12_08235 [Omnitrophica bacterium RIFCSPLOWO2_02_FULL_44_11]